MQKNEDYSSGATESKKGHEFPLGCQQGTKRERWLKTAPLIRKSSLQEDGCYFLDAFLLPKTQQIMSGLAPDPPDEVYVTVCLAQVFFPLLQVLVLTTWFCPQQFEFMHQSFYCTSFFHFSSFFLSFSFLLRSLNRSC